MEFSGKYRLGRVVLITVLYIIFAVIVIPAVITLVIGRGGGFRPAWAERGGYGEPSEEYLIGVLGAEMPALFDAEALKAQAVAARTYAVKTGADKNSDGQAYLSKAELKEKWGASFNKYYNKIRDAVEETEGEILIYEGEPILAVFHAQSAGYTRNAENVWNQALPYLVSTRSKGDETAGDFSVSVEFAPEEIMERLCNAYGAEFAGNDFMMQFEILCRGSDGYVDRVRAGNKELSGNEVRAALSLRSADFTVREVGGMILITTKGYGHGVGMSQYGANCMARDGYGYKEILTHYYTGATLAEI